MRKVIKATIISLIVITGIIVLVFLALVFIGDSYLKALVLFVASAAMFISVFFSIYNNVK